MDTRRIVVWGGLLALHLAGCAPLGLARTEAPRLFALEAELGGAAARDADALPVLIALPAARPGYASARMVYVTQAHEIRFFARHEWVAPPVQMLRPLLVEALEVDGRFHAIPSAAGVTPALRLESEILALQQEFTQRPSRTRFALRAQLFDVAERRALATEEFEAVEPAPSEDPYGGVVAANRAVARVARDVAKWCDAQAPRSRAK